MIVWPHVSAATAALSGSHRKPPALPGDGYFSNSNVNFSQGGNVSVGHQNLQGAQWDRVLADLQGLKAAVGGMPTSKVAELNARIDEAIVLADQAKTQPEKKGLLKKAVDGIEVLAGAVESGEKLAGPIASLIALVAPLLGA